MATTHTDTNVNQLVINKLTKQEYNNLQQVSDTELYLVEEQVDNVVTQNSTNPVQSGAVYEALQDIGSSINDGTTWFIKNNQTVGIISANQALDKTIKIPNDIIMCKMSDGIVYDSYITYTKIKQYLPDYPYYSDDLNWEIGGNPPIRASITEGNYYLDVDTNHIFVADEILELLDITSSVVIHGDPNKLYCNVDDNKLYRYDGSNFITLTSNFSGDYNDLSNKPLSVESNKVKYTLSDGTTKLTLAQESELKTVAFSGSYNDLTDKLQNATTSVSGLMSANDKSHIQNITKNYYNAYNNVAVNNIINDIIRTRENGYYTETGSAVFNSNCSELPNNTVTLVEWFRAGNMGYKTFLKAFTNDNKFWVGYFLTGTTPTSITWKEIVKIENTGTVTFIAEYGLTFNSVICKLIPGAVIFQFYQLQDSNGDMPDYSTLFTLSGISASTDSYGTITDCDTGKSNTLYFANTNNTIQCGGGITQAHKYSGHIVININ